MPEAQPQDHAPSAEHVPANALEPFLAVTRRPRHLLLLIGVCAFIGLVVGWGSSSILYGAAAFAIAALGPVLVLLRLVSRTR